MVEKRIVTKNKNGEIVKIIEHHDLVKERKDKWALAQFCLFLGLLVGGLIAWNLSLHYYRF